MLRVVFTAPDASPKVEVTDPGIDRRFARAAAEWAEGYRLPCHDGGKPVSAEQLFHFMSEADDGLTAVLQNTDLFTFLRGVKDIRQQKKYLDLNQMGCPFELRLRYLQPHMPNEILEPGTPVPERKLLIEWLATLQLNTNGREQQNQLLGQAMTLAVPCGKIDL